MHFGPIPGTAVGTYVSDWAQKFAWWPVRTVSGQFIWFERVYCRQSIRSYRCEERYIRIASKTTEYATLFDILGG